MAEKNRRNKIGRPPAGLVDGERVSEYPRLSCRLPKHTFERLQALADILGRPQWRILSEAVDRYIAELPGEQRDLIGGLIGHAAPLLRQPVKGVRAVQEGVRILNVDDNDAMRFARSSILRAEGFEVLEAATGREALRTLESQGANLVLLDVNLPDMSGIEVCRRIKDDGRWDHVKVVQVSATFSSPRDQLNGLEAGGADIYLAEPVQRGTLLSIVRRLAASA